tara:strand:- start:11640 stop:15695 length:4056 start_codon:yes stop_codon:yes gene_type:complete
MAKRANVTSKQTSANWDNYTQYNSDGTNLIGSSGFGESMPRFVQGISCLQANGELKIYIFFKDDAGYDVITNVTDAGLKNTIEFNHSTCGKSSVSLTYKNFRRKKSSIFNLNLLFASGVERNINLRVPGLNSQLNSNVENVTSVLTESPYQNILSVELVNNLVETRSLTKIHKISDPYNVYDYSGLVQQNLPFAFYLNSESLNEALVDANVSSSNSKVEKGISPRGVGNIYGGPDIQEIHFLQMLGGENIETSTQFSNEIEFNMFTSSFIYSENLFNIPDNAPTFYVCLNKNDSTYFKTTQTDCDGTAIDADYLDGSQPARFLDGQCCNILCDDFEATITNTSPQNVHKNNDSKGSIKINITGGQGDYTYAISSQGAAMSDYGITTASVSSDQSEYEFTGITLKDKLEYPFKITVTDANGCTKVAYIQLDKETISEPGLLLGCTDTGALNYDSGADHNSGCIWCKLNGPRGETYKGLGFGLTDGSTIRALGVELFNVQSYKVTHATSSGASDGKIFIRGEVFPGAVAAIDTDADASYTIKRYSLGTADDANNLTKGEILALSASSSFTGLSSPTKEITGLAKGWYAISIEVANLPAAAQCVSVFRYKVGYGGCTDINANNFDSFAKYDNQGCQYDCPPTTEHVTIGNTREACMKTVSVGSPQAGDTINWVIGDRTATGPGPHLAMAEEYVTVYRENSRTKCSTSGETYIDATDCIVESAEVPGMARNYNTVQGQTLLGTLFFEEFITLNTTNQGGCTNPTAYNFDCNALWDNGSCIETRFGCTSPTAINYEPNANIDDGSCFEGIQGCCDMQSPDYNPLANICIECGPATLGDDAHIISRIAIGNVIASIGPPCEASLNSFNGDATSNELTLQAIEFAATSSVIHIPPGLKIRAYRIPMGGNTIEGYSVNNIQFPMEDSGWPVECTWTLTGTDRSPVNAAMDNGGYLTYVTETGAILTNNIDPSNIYQLNNTTWIGEGSVGYGPHILEITIPSPGGGKYHGRVFVNAPNGCIVNGLQLTGTNSVGCTDPTASNYNPSTSLSNFAAANVGYGANQADAQGEFWFPYRQFPNSWFDPGFTTIGGVSNSTALGNTNDADDQFVCIHHYGNGPSDLGNQGLPCIPPNMYRKLKYINRCISNGSINWFNNHITGRDTKCEERKLTIMSLIKYLLERQGLECVFNCADSGTKDFHAESCAERWEAGGSKVWEYDSTGMGNNDIITNDIWYFDFSENGGVPPVWLGDAPPNSYWVLDRVIPDSYAPNDETSPFGASAKIAWHQCVDQKNFTETTNYLDNFFKFASTYCESCGPCQYIPGNRTTFLKAHPPIVPVTNVSDSNSLRLGGISLTLGEEEFS